MVAATLSKAILHSNTVDTTKVLRWVPLYSLISRHPERLGAKHGCVADGGSMQKQRFGSEWEADMMNLIRCNMGKAHPSRSS